MECQKRFHICQNSVFVATWNVGGKTPTSGLNLKDFLQVEGSSDIYVLGFQEIVPLSAGNVLVVEDNAPASKWLILINQALNSHSDDPYLRMDSNPTTDLKDSKLFQKPSLKILSRHLRAGSKQLKSCNCPPIESEQQRARNKGEVAPSRSHHDRNMEEELHAVAGMLWPHAPSGSMRYGLILCKQMVGIFLSVWVRKELVRHIGHLRVSSMGRGIMGCLRNKGCITVSMTVHHTSFCFVCSHLASGEKEGDEVKRNADVSEILKGTAFPNICQNPRLQIPELIIDHDRIIWLGDLNYRIALKYEETRLLLEDNDWDSLLQKDQLNMEREAGRVFSGWSEGSILFAPTYKYSHNSDCYAGETIKSKRKRRTPAWCDRILWKGDGMEQLSYIRGESRFSDHRPVCAVFSVEVVTKEQSSILRKGNSCNSLTTAAAATTTTAPGYDDPLLHRFNFCKSR